MAAEDSDDSPNYANQIRDAESDSLRRLCFSAGLSRSGNAPAKRNRLLSYAAGSARRQRIHWLELFLVAEQAGFDPSGSGPFDFTVLDDHQDAVQCNRSRPCVCSSGPCPGRW